MLSDAATLCDEIKKSQSILVYLCGDEHSTNIYNCNGNHKSLKKRETHKRLSPHQTQSMPYVMRLVYCRSALDIFWNSSIDTDCITDWCTNNTNADNRVWSPMWCSSKKSGRVRASSCECGFRKVESSMLTTSETNFTEVNPRPSFESKADSLSDLNNKTPWHNTSLIYSDHVCDVNEWKWELSSILFIKTGV